MNLLAVVAHPDDASIFCGGTIAKHADRGDHVHIVYMTRGEYGGTGERTESELAEKRVTEAEKAGEILGTATSFLDFKDGRIQYSLDARQRLNEVIREHQPDSILTHHRADDHPDHRITGQLVHDAYYYASLPMVESEYDPVEPENLYYVGKPSAGFEPEIFVDITEYYHQKEKAIESHESQIDFLEAHGALDRQFDDILDGVRAQARASGRRAGVRYAEGFSQLHSQSIDYLG